MRSVAVGLVLGMFVMASVSQGQEVKPGDGKTEITPAPVEYNKLANGRSWDAAAQDGDYEQVAAAIDAYLADDAASPEKVMVANRIYIRHATGAEDYAAAKAVATSGAARAATEGKLDFQCEFLRAGVKAQLALAEITPAQALAAFADIRASYVSPGYGLRQQLALVAAEEVNLLRAHVGTDEAAAHAHAMISRYKPVTHFALYAALMQAVSTPLEKARAEGMYVSATKGTSPIVRLNWALRTAPAKAELQAAYADVVEQFWSVDAPRTVTVYKMLDFNLWDEAEWVALHRRLRGVIRNTAETQQLLQLIGNELAKYEL